MAVVKEGRILSKGRFGDETQIRIVHNAPAGTDAHLDYIRLNYKRKLALYGSSTVFRTGCDVKGTSFIIKDSNADVMVWCLKDDGSAYIVPSVWNDGNTVTLGADFSSSDRLVAVNPKGVFPEPEVVGEVKNQNLHGTDSVDMVIVVPASGKLQAQARAHILEFDIERLLAEVRDHDLPALLLPLRHIPALDVH